jgi:hypothetical protein
MGVANTGNCSYPTFGEHNQSPTNGAVRNPFRFHLDQGKQLSAMGEIFLLTHLSSWQKRSKQHNGYKLFDCSDAA